MSTRGQEGRTVALLPGGNLIQKREWNQRVLVQREMDTESVS